MKPKHDEFDRINNRLTTTLFSLSIYISHSLPAEMPPLCSSPGVGQLEILGLERGRAALRRKSECRPRARPRNEEGRGEREERLLKRTNTNGFPLLPRAALCVSISLHYIPWACPDGVEYVRKTRAVKTYDSGVLFRRAVFSNIPSTLMSLGWRGKCGGCGGECQNWRAPHARTLICSR